MVQYWPDIGNMVQYWSNVGINWKPLIWCHIRGSMRQDSSKKAFQIDQTHGLQDHYHHQHYYYDIVDILTIVVITIQVSFNCGRTRSSSSNLNLRPTRTSLFMDSYFNRIVLLWNNLPITTRQSSSLNVFKENLYTIYFRKLDTDFDPDRVRQLENCVPPFQGSKARLLLAMYFYCKVFCVCVSLSVQGRALPGPQSPFARPSSRLLYLFACVCVCVCVFACVWFYLLLW